MLRRIFFFKRGKKMAITVKDETFLNFIERIKQYSGQNMIFFQEEPISKGDLLKKMVDLIVSNSDAVDVENDFLQNVLEREKIGSTGIGAGIAIPHARFSGAKKMVISIALLQNPIDFTSPDGEGVRLVVMIGAPKEQGKEYLTLISTLVRAFRNKEYREHILMAKDTDELVKTLIEFK